MKSNHRIQKIAIFVSGIAVFALSSVNAADVPADLGNKTSIVNKAVDNAGTNTLCPNGQTRGTRQADCTVGKTGRQGNFARGKKGNSNGGQFARGRCGNGRQGNFAKGRGGRSNGHGQGRKGIGPGKGLGDGTGTRDGACLQSEIPVVES